MRSLLRVLLVLACSTLLPSLGWSEESAQELSWQSWGEFKALYDAGKYDEALQALRAHPADSSAYYFNLGNTHYRLGQYGIAAGYFEKAKQRKPFDPDIQAGLNLAQGALERQGGKQSWDPSSSWLESLADGIRLEEIQGVLALVAFVTLFFWARTYRRSRSLRATILSSSGVLCVLAFLLTSGLFLARRTADQHPPAVVLQEQIVRSGPGESYSDLVRLQPGIRIRLLGPSVAATGGADVWKQVRYSEDGIGWIRASGLLLL